MSNNSGYRVNEDGSVTKISSEGSTGRGGGSNNSGGSSSNTGCIWFTVLAVVVGIIVAISNSISSDSSSCDEDSESAVIEESVTVDEPYISSASYLNVSDDEIYMSAEGGSTEITVFTDGDWYIDVYVADWGHLNKNSDLVTIQLDRNTSTSSRTDYFVIKSGDYSRQINITQYGNIAPAAEIEQIWLDHNAYQDGQKGMKIHLKFTVDNMNGNTVYVYALLYYGDNVTALQNVYGNHLSFMSYGIPDYDNCRFEDFQIFVPYDELSSVLGVGSFDLSFDISIQSSRDELAGACNTPFTYTNY